MTTSLKKVYSYKFAIPVFFIYGIMFILPTILSFILSLTDWNTYNSNISAIHFIGLDNFINIFSDATTIKAFKNTLVFTVIITVFKMFFGLVMALFLNRGLKTQGYMRIIFFFPCILSTIAVGLMFKSIFHPTNGLVNVLLGMIGLSSWQRDWFGNVSLVMYSISAVEIWKWTGFHMIIFLAGIQSIDKTYYQAAEIDGASYMQKLKYITLPLLMNAINTNLIFCLIGGLKVFEIVISSTNGGPGYASEVLSTLLYKRFAQGYFSLSTAYGFLLFLVISLITFPIYYFLQKKEVEY